MLYLNAELGYNNLKNLKQLILQKSKLEKVYNSLFKNTKIQFLNENKSSKSNFWLNTILLKDDQIKYRDKILDYCYKKGINCRPAWNLISEMDIYKKCPRSDLSISKKLQKKIINLPSGLNILTG